LVEDRGRLAKAPSRLGGSDRSAQGQLSHDRFDANRPPCQKDADIAQLFGKAQAIYREIGKELNDVPLTGGGSDGNFTAALGIPDRFPRCPRYVRSCSKSGGKADVPGGPSRANS
jgi:hypothetical protein